MLRCIIFFKLEIEGTQLGPVPAHFGTGVKTMYFLMGNPMGMVVEVTPGVEVPTCDDTIFFFAIWLNKTGTLILHFL